MTSAVEQFTIQLARVSKRGSRHLRGLMPADRQDVIGSAILWCWEHKHEFDSTTQSLEDWFAERLKAARRSLVTATKREPIADTGGSSPDPAREAESQDSLEKLAASLTPDERRVARLLGEGYSERSIAAQLTWINRSTLKVMHHKLHKLRDLLPSEPPTIANSDVAKDSDSEEREPAPIDHEIEKLLRRPSTERGDCPVCFRCCWFNGLKPINYKPPKLVDSEIRAAVTATEAEKIRIAKWVTNET